MKTFEYTIADPFGMHARPAGLLVHEAKEYKSKVTVSAADKTCDAASLFGLMGMGIKCGMPVTVSVEGEDEELCAGALKQWFKENL